jgi:hypothetical protein
MTYLQNWPIAVLLAALMPIIIHMLNRLRYRTVQWAAMIFLLKANKAATRRAKLRQYLLLLFRALAILFLVWGMMRPVVGGWLGATTGGAPEVVMILLDRSASMETRGGAEGAASRRAHAIELLEQAAKNSAGSRFVLVENVLRQPLEIADATTLGSMQMTQPTETAADVPAMLRVALEYLVKNKPGSAEVWLASDLQSTTWRPESPEWQDIAARFAGLPQETRVRILDLSSAPGTNLSVAVRAADYRPAKDNAERGTLALATEFKSTGATGTFPLRMTRDGATNQSDLVLNAPVQRQAFKFDIVKMPEGGGWGTLELPADENPADNTAYYVYRPPVAMHATVLSESGGARRLSAASAPDPTRGDRSVETLRPADAGQIKWKESALIIWHAPSPAEDIAAKLRAYVEGGGVLLTLPIGGEGGNGVMGLTWTAAENAPEPLRVTSWDDLDGPLARTDSGMSLPLGRLEVNRRQVPRLGTETVHVHALFADGEPFLVEQRIGNGRLFALATVPDPEWSTLGEGVVLLPMVQRMLAIGATRLVPPALATAGEWQPTEGEFWTPVQEGERRDPRWRAGVYKHAGKLIALNRPDREDSAEVVKADLLPTILKGVKLTVMAGALDLKADRLQSEIWPIMIIATMIFMCLEMLLATSKGIVPAKAKAKPPVPSRTTPERETSVTGGSAK